MSAPAPAARYAGRLVASGLLLLGAGVPYLLIALLVAGRWQPLVQLDDDVEQAANRAVLGSDALLGAARVATELGGGTVRLGVVLLVAGWLLVRQRRRLAVFLAVTVVGGTVLNVLLKVIVHRARPVLPDAVAVETSTSFPSGHTMGATVLALSLLLIAWPTLGRLRPAAAVLAGLFVAAVAASRVLLGVHYLTDVIAAAFAGTVWVVLSAIVFLGWRADRGRPPTDPLTDGLEPEELEEQRPA